MTRLVAKNRLAYFAYYLIILAIVLMIVGLWIRLKFWNEHNIFD
jgi:undecaprenyl pyrophosphate phosphatase UppP